MRWKLLNSVVGPLLLNPAFAADSVVIGRDVSNEYIGEAKCPADHICLNSIWVWEFDAKRTIAGPKLNGKVRALTEQDASATASYIASVEVFVVRPIRDSKVREKFGVSYRLVSVSPLYHDGKYCLSEEPVKIGLRLSKSQIAVDPASGYYCFNKSLIVGAEP